MIQPSRDTPSKESSSSDIEEEKLTKLHGTVRSSSKALGKPVSKVSSIKKLLNKKIKLGSHILFDDEEGEVEINSVTNQKERYKGLGDSDDESESSDVPLSLTPVPIDDYKSCGSGGCDMEVGGIKIQEAQRKIVARDKIDRKLERERIQKAHRERRQKGKKVTRHVCGNAILGGEDGQFSGSSEEEEEEKIMKRKRKKLGKEEPEEEEKINLGMKRKRKKKLEKKELESEEDLPQLREDEELAKHLLGI